MRERLVTSCALLLMLASSLALSASGSRPGHSGFALLARAGDRWTVQYTPGVFSRTPVPVSGRTYQFFGGDAASSMTAVGAPQLPADALTLGVPWGRKVDAALVDAVYEDQPGVLIAPCPTYTVDDSLQTTANFTVDNGIYAQNRFLPSQQVVVDPPFTLRRQRICTIRIAPYLYNPSTQLLRRLVRAQLDISLVPDIGTGAQIQSAAGEGTDPYFEDVYKSLIWNYEEAKAWRGASSVSRAQRDSTRDWFNVGQRYVRIPVAVDGWYRVPVQDLVSAGIMASDLSRLQLYYHGKEIPVLVRDDSTVEFYGRRNNGDSTYYNSYTDTSAYWFTVGDRDGVRYVASGIASGNASVVRSAITTVHLEQNTDYYEGTGESEITRNGMVPGEGWVWEYYYPGTSISHDFALDSLDLTGGAAALRVRLYGTTVHSITPDHHAQIWVNDSLAGDVSFDGREGVLFAGSIPTTWLVAGTNHLRIGSVPTANGINQFYLDWFEVDYPRILKATNGQLTFTLGPGYPVRASVSGFPYPTVDVFDISSGRRIEGVIVSGDSAAGFTATFEDTASSPRTYVACAPASAMRTFVGAAKTFGDLRTSATGADYIIVSHGDFLSAAQRLAAQRRSFNGVRAFVADVQDIYDQFNYGTPDVYAIKRFLQNAYSTWPSPAPAFLLLLGDASWDPHRYMRTSTRTDFVPAYGVPSSDNWYGCFDSVDVFIPSLMIGRVCVQSPAQAAAVVDKIVGFDSTPLGDWDKRFMFITGGLTAYEQADFNATTESMIGSYVNPAPVGGTPLRVYKASGAVIDGEHTQEMRQHIKDGVGFVNFLGHSGGRTWGVDIGSPYDMENTNGQFPFVSSVSCNAGAFAEPSNNLLSEDFVLAENRGAIGMWSSSSLGYAYTGSLLVGYFLDGLSQNMREFGKLTTLARYRLRTSFGAGSIIESALNSTPLQGDPLSRFPLPLKPDLGITPGDISVVSSGVQGQGTPIGLRIKLHNYGLVTPDSVVLSITDIYAGKQTDTRQRVGPQFHLDSVSVAWSASDEPGKHSIAVSLDPDAALDEITRINNVASIDNYVYAKTLVALKPADNAVVSPGAQTLTVGLPEQGGIAGLQVLFELDTVASFSSSAKILSGPVVPGPVSAVWKTPALAAERAYFWRARTVNGGTVGGWVVAAFVTKASGPALPMVRRAESTAEQFSRAVLGQTAATDSGVTIAPGLPLQIWSRSFGDRGGITHHVYSRLGINNVVVWGYEWELGQSLMAARVSEYDGSYLFKAFDLKSDPLRADSLKNFINTTPTGNYIVLSVIFDGHTNVTDSLVMAVEALGSTQFRNVLPGQSWAFIGRKGYPAAALEQLTNDSAVVSLQIPNYYSRGSGTVATSLLSPPSLWSTFHWRGDVTPGVTALRFSVLGSKPTGTVDTLASMPSDSTDMSLAGLNGLRGLYSGYQFLARLSTGDALRTPVLKEWWYDAELPADVAISSQSLGTSELSIARGTELQLPVTVHNLGYRRLDSARVTVSLYDERNMLRPIATAGVDSLPADGSRTIAIPLSTQELPARSSIRVRVDPISAQEELCAINNGADFAFAVTGASPAGMQISADGVSLMDGDYVAAAPKMLIHLTGLDELGLVHRSLEAFVDGLSVTSQQEGDLAFTPSLAAGSHSVRIVGRISNALGFVDSLQRELTLNVADEYRILQLFNFPNPFARETYVSFVLTGARPPDEATLRIFTVAGRKIRQIQLPAGSLQIGVNRIFWDGRDNDGDDVANGYYFYQVQVTAGEKTEAAIGKMVRVQ